MLKAPSARQKRATSPPWEGSRLRRSLDFLTNSADPFTNFVDGVIHGRTGALGRAARAGASENKKAGNKDKKCE